MNQLTQRPIKYKSYQEKQSHIIELLLKFRHLNQKQIQVFLHHKATERIRTLLDDLTEKGYLQKEYARKFAYTPSEYTLAIKSIAYLRKKGVEETFLKRLYNEKYHSRKFRDHCMFLADVFLSLCSFTEQNHTILRFETKTGLYKIKYLILPHPDAYFSIQKYDGSKKRYFLEVFDDRIFIYKRVYQYLEYYSKNYWQYKTDTPFPEIIFICPDEFTKKSIYKFIQDKLSYNAPLFYLTTKQQILEHGMCQEVLKKVEI